MSSFSRHLALILALAVAPSVVACNKDKKSDDSAEKSGKDKGSKNKGDDDDDKGAKKKGDDDDKSAKKKGDDDDKGSKKKGDDDDKGGSDYAVGDVLKRLPTDCKEGRIYVDLQALQKNEAFKANADTLDDKMAEAMKGPDGEKAEAMLKSLKKQGISPLRDLRDFALCMKGEHKAIGVFGGNFEGKKTLDKLSKAVTDADKEEAPTAGDVDGISYLQLKSKKSKASYLGAITDDVFGVVDDKEDLSQLKKTGGDPSWAAGKGRILAVKINVPKNDEPVEFSLTDKGDELEGKFHMKLPAKDAKAAKKNPAMFKTGMLGAIPGLDKGPLSPIADDLKATKVDIDDDGTVKLTVTVTNAHLATLIKKVSAMSEKELEGDDK
jgi:hypothetical protein